MNKIQYININGQFHKADSEVFSIKNRCFQYGDGLFETIHALGTELQYPADHYQRLCRGLDKLQIQKPDSFSFEFFTEQIIKLLNKNRIYKGARIRFAAYRAEGGFYTPVKNHLQFAIEASPLESEKYELNSKGLTIDIFDKIKKPINILSSLKTSNALLFTLAGVHKNNLDVDECILLNENGHICESISSNVFLIQDNTIYTPPVSDGCIEGVMRKQIIRLAQQLDYKVCDYLHLNIEQLEQAEEIFICNAIKGIQWIVAYKKKRYFNFTSKKLIQALNRDAFK